MRGSSSTRQARTATLRLRLPGPQTDGAVIATLERLKAMIPGLHEASPPMTCCSYVFTVIEKERFVKCMRIYKWVKDDRLFRFWTPPLVGQPNDAVYYN